MTLQKLNIQPKVDNAAKKKMVTSNEIGVNETLLANEVNQLVETTNKLVEGFNQISPITGFKFKENLPTYADLAMVENPQLNDGYGVIADGLIYVHNGVSFPTEGNGMDLGLKPNGIVFQNEVLAVSGNEVYNSLEPIKKELKFDVADNELILQPKINPEKRVWNASGVLDIRGHNAWFTAVSDKNINRIGVPIVHKFGGVFTGGLNVMVGLNDEWIFKKLIPFSEIEPFNNLDLNSSNVDDFFYFIDFQNTELKTGDILFVGIYTEEPNDKVGFCYTQDLVNEWAMGKGGYLANDFGTDYVTPPTIYIGNPNQYSFQFYSTNRFEQGVKKVVETMNIIPEKQYFSKDLVRSQIGSFLNKLQLKQDATVVCYGDSITQFQNSETLSNSEQQVNPIGLSGNSWVRQLWESIQYRDTDIIYRRFDHSDFTFSNGIQSTSSVIGSFGWATNRNDAEGWRGNDVEGVFAQTITPISTYNKPVVGTNKAGEFFTITIPDNATIIDLTFIMPTLGSSVKIEIGSEINETLVLNNDNLKPTEVVKTYNISAGSSKVLKVTNIDSSNFWFYGISWRTKASVRVVNSGTGGYNVELLRQNWKFEPQVKNYNPDLVIYEVNSSNDVNLSSVSLQQHSEKVNDLMSKLKDLNCPVLVILTHRFETQYINRSETSENIQNSVQFIPELIKNYRASAYKNDFAVLDIFSKSVDILGKTNTVDLPPNFFVDNGHLGVDGNKMYVDELKEIFLTRDFE